MLRSPVGGGVTSYAVSEHSRRNADFVRRTATLINDSSHWNRPGHAMLLLRRCLTRK